MNEYAPRMKKLGPLGKSEGMDKDQLKLKIGAVTRLIPYIKLVERERLRAPLKLRASAEPEEAHIKFFESDELNGLVRYDESRKCYALSRVRL